MRCPARCTAEEGPGAVQGLEKGVGCDVSVLGRDGAEEGEGESRGGRAGGGVVSGASIKVVLTWIGQWGTLWDQ